MTTTDCFINNPPLKCSTATMSNIESRPLVTDSSPTVAGAELVSTNISPAVVNSYANSPTITPGMYSNQRNIICLCPMYHFY